MDPIDLTEVLAAYEGKWVVLSNDLKSVLFSGDQVEDILPHIASGVIMKVTDFIGSYTP